MKARKTEELRARVDPKLKALTRAIAEKKGLDESDIIRVAVKEFIHHNAAELLPA